MDAIALGFDHEAKRQSNTTPGPVSTILYIISYIIYEQHHREANEQS